MSSALYRLGRFAARHPWRAIGLWLIAAIAVVGASSAWGRDLEDSFDVPGVDSQLAVDLLSSARSDQAGLTARIVALPLEGDWLDASTEVRTALSELQANVEALPHVIATNDPAGVLDSGSDTAMSAGALSPDGQVVLMQVQYPVLGALSATDLERLEDTVDSARAGGVLRVEAGGDLFFAFDEPEAGAELIGILAAMVILLLAFGSVIAMGLPIGLAIFGLALGVSSMSLVTYLVDIPSWVPDIGAMVGLGVGIDYALFVVTRHREFLARDLSVEESVGRAVATAGQAVVFAGGTVVIAILGLAVAGVPFMTAAGVATSIIVLIMVLASITLLPAFLGLAGHWINRIGIHRRGVHRSGNATQRSTWARWGAHVSGRSWEYAIGGTLLLLAMAVPVLSLRLGFPDEGTLPESTTQRRAYDLVADAFGPGLNGPLLIAIDISQDSTVVAPLATAIAADPGIAGVAPADIDPTAGVATLVAFPTSSPQDDLTVATIERLRSEVIPGALADSPARAHVGGQAANVSDVAGRVTERLPWFVAAVVVLSFLLLMVTFRSILVPLKAAILNLLSIGAAYGVMVMVFQWGWGKNLIGLEATIPIVSFVPMFMFAILFGLSMDYEVFLLSRIREEYLRTGDNDASVIHGIAGTARVITSAALIMISVFGGFVLGDDPTTKMFGLGLATAILIDATIVRIVLVPATMQLMGDANWWLPSWLDKRLPAIDIEGGAGLPLPARVEPVRPELVSTDAGRRDPTG